MFSAAVEEWGELLMDMGNREVGDLKVLWQPMTLGKLSIISLNTTEIPEPVSVRNPRNTSIREVGMTHNRIQPFLV